ncbi:MAG: hypothetical protein LKF50_04950, partial [Solobacterium sp.]|nr:hypothetical protein [Solobacterium sp.]
ENTEIFNNFSVYAGIVRVGLQRYEVSTVKDRLFSRHSHPVTSIINFDPSSVFIKLLTSLLYALLFLSILHLKAIIIATNKFRLIAIALFVQAISTTPKIEDLQ